MKGSLQILNLIIGYDEREDSVKIVPFTTLRTLRDSLLNDDAVMTDMCELIIQRYSDDDMNNEDYARLIAYARVHNGEKS